MSLIRAGLNVDDVASYMSTQEEEYEEIEKWLSETLPNHQFKFTRDFPPQDLMTKKLELYLFDYGGLCKYDLSGACREGLARRILEAAKEKPNTLFVPWSKMTLDYWKFAAEEFFPELVTEPNVYIPDPARFYDDLERSMLTSKLKEWFQ